MIVIGLSGKARGGKGSVVQLAQILMQHGDTEVEVRQVSFATALKKMARERGWDGEKDEKGRTLLQDLGMQMRKVDPNFWVKAAVRKVVHIGIESPMTKIVFIPDCRFKNEAHAIIGMSAPDATFENYNLRAVGIERTEIWRVERHNADGTLYDNGLSWKQKQHQSETELDDWPFDLTIHSSDMADLFEGVKKALARLGFS
jgi:hypothetical protein